MADMNTPIKILIVDDKDYIRELYSALFADSWLPFAHQRSLPSVQCRLASNAEEGLEQYVQSPTDLVISDWNCGRDRQNTGYWFARELHARSPNIPLILITGSRDDQLREDPHYTSDVAIVRAVIHKPFKADTLFEVIFTNLNGKIGKAPNSDPKTYILP